MNDIEFKIKKLVSEQLGISIETISIESNFIKDLGGDSLDTVEMVLSLEDEFGFEVDEEVAENLYTVGDVIRLVQSKSTA